jgi:bifunctional UDP-N-acetylglucosamine pyrophosphorylase/glucosamine-1-phosphate N-acetyltransferase
MKPVADSDSRAALSLATCVVDDPTGYGRVLRKDGQGRRDSRAPGPCAADERARVREINAGIYAANVALLREALASLAPNNAQGELYLTDIVAFASNAGERIATVSSEDVLAGVNDREQLVQVDRAMHARIVRSWRRPARPCARGRASTPASSSSPTHVESGVVLRGTTHVAAARRSTWGACSRT